MDVVVIGAGCAGLSAAVRLAEAGVTVAVVEAAPRLGGRATAFTDKHSGDRLDNGQHALFGCYHETYAFLRTLGTDTLAPLDSSLSLVMADRTGRQSRLVCPRWPAPWHLAAGVLRWNALPWSDRLTTLTLGRWLHHSRRHGPEAAAAQVPADLTVSQWLAQMGQSPAICEWLWHPLALAALNQAPGVASAQPFARVLAELFGPDPEASSLGVPRVPLDELYAEPAARHIEARGGVVLRRTPARIRRVGGTEGLEVTAGDHRWTPRAVVSAVPWHALDGLWPDDPPAELADTLQRARSMTGAPIVSVNLWFDRPVMTERQVGLVGTEFHWAFRQNELVADFAAVPENQLRAHLVALVASGAGALVRRENDDLAALAEQDLRACVPSAQGAACLRSLVVREPRATFSLAPGAPTRPGTATPIRGFYLAGDWTDTGLPGTIEGAVKSGHGAAAAVLRGL